MVYSGIISSQLNVNLDATKKKQIKWTPSTIAVTNSQGKESSPCKYEFNRRKCWEVKPIRDETHSQVMRDTALYIIQIARLSRDNPVITREGGRSKSCRKAETWTHEYRRLLVNNIEHRRTKPNPYGVLPPRICLIWHRPFSLDRSAYTTFSVASGVLMSRWLLNRPNAYGYY